MQRRRLTLVLVAALVLLAGCSGSAGDASGGVDAGGDASTVAEMDANPEARDAGGGDGGDGGGGNAGSEEGEFAGTDRSIVRTGEVQLEVEEYETARSNLTDAVESRGGYVSESNQRVHERDGAEWTSGRVVLRVPADNFSATMTAVEREGHVRESGTSSEDVTEQVVDLEARLANLRAERDRLRTLYDRANDTEDVLAVERRLSEVQTEIERTEARLQHVQRRVAYATITVQLSEPRPDRPVAGAWYDTPVVTAFLNSVEGVGVALRALAVAGAYAAPYLLVFLAPFVVVGGLLFRYRSRFL